jgi:ubiquinone/menaquinone biosynthesis C-methylase UbiE
VDLHYLKKFYTPGKIFVADIKPDRVASTISVFPEARGAALDNHNLGLKDNSFDYVMVAASLHHLGEPLRGFYELLRVARCGLIVVEPHDCWLTRLFEKLGWAHEYEVEHGNYVYRFSKRDVVKIAKSLFFKCEILRFFAMHYLGNSRAKFFIFKFLNNFGNIVFPYWGNYIIFVFTKEKVLPKCMQKEPK